MNSPNIGVATYPGTCWVCGNPINIGDPIVRPGASGWIHRMCFLQPIIELARQMFKERRHDNMEMRWV